MAKNVEKNVDTNSDLTYSPCPKARQSGVLQLYTLPRFSLDHRYQTNVTASKIAINCNATRISIINPDGLMSFFDLVISEILLQLTSYLCVLWCKIVKKLSSEYLLYL